MPGTIIGTGHALLTGLGRLQPLQYTASWAAVLTRPWVSLTVDSKTRVRSGKPE